MLGPIERELRSRAAGGRDGSPKLGAEAFRVFSDAAFSLGDQWGAFERGLPGVSTRQHWPDIMSEAIEAAEALGL